MVTLANSVVIKPLEAQSDQLCYILFCCTTTYFVHIVGQQGSRWIVSSTTSRHYSIKYNLSNVNQSMSLIILYPLGKSINHHILSQSHCSLERLKYPLILDSGPH